MSVGGGLQAFPSPVPRPGVGRGLQGVGRGVGGAVSQGGVGRGLQGVARSLARARGLSAARAGQFYGESPGQWNQAFNQGFSRAYRLSGGGVGRGLSGI